VLTAIVGERGLLVRAINRTDSVGSGHAGRRGGACIDVAISGSDGEVDALVDSIRYRGIDGGVGSTTKRHGSNCSTSLSVKQWSL
jgi:hypothetical protein